MTREETIKYGLDLCKQELGMDGSIFIPKLVNTAYLNCKNDFESRTCENCRWYKNVGEPFNVCKLYGISHGKDFGCNKFESRQA